MGGSAGLVFCLRVPRLRRSRGRRLSLFAAGGVSFVFAFFPFFLLSRETFCESVGYILYKSTVNLPPAAIPMNQRLSSLPGLLEACFGRQPLLPGSLYTLRRKCGKASCRCARGELHASTVLSYRGQGRPRNISPAPEQVEPVRNMTEAYRQCRNARARLVRWQKQLLRLVDELEAARVLLGDAEFQKLGLAPDRKSRAAQTKSGGEA
jgi:hypothetical protein